MKKFVILPLCLSLSTFVLARPTKTSHMLPGVAKTHQEPSTTQKADAPPLPGPEEQEAATEEETDNEVASDDEGKDMSDDDGGGDNEGDDDDSGSDDDGVASGN